MEYEDGFLLDEHELWEHLSNSNDTKTRQVLIQHYMPYAKMLAATLFAKRIDNTIDYSDYEQLSFIGLLEAIDRYDYKKGASFETYASYRIKGSIYNGLGNQTEKRSQYVLRESLFNERIKSFSTKKSGSDNEYNFSDFVNITIGLAFGYMIDPVDNNTVVSNSAVIDPYAHSEYDYMKLRVNEAIKLLTGNEKKIIEYHYFYQISFSDLAAMLGLSKGRVSQIHKNAIINIRTSFEKLYNIDTSY